MDRFIPLENLKVFRSSWKPGIYFLAEFIYPLSYIGISFFMNTDKIIKVIWLLGVTALYGALTFYCSFAISVSRVFSILKII